MSEKVSDFKVRKVSIYNNEYKSKGFKAIQTIFEKTLTRKMWSM
jgi:hypothetical protein